MLTLNFMYANYFTLAIQPVFQSESKLLKEREREREREIALKCVRILEYKILRCQECSIKKRRDVMVHDLSKTSF